MDETKFLRELIEAQNIELKLTLAEIDFLRDLIYRVHFGEATIDALKRIAEEVKVIRGRAKTE